MSKTVFRILFAFCFVIPASRTHAQQAATASVNLPILSFLTDGAGNLRPMIGIVGSASVGAPLNVGFEVVGAVIPPDHDYILAVTRDGNWPALLQVRGNAVTVRSTEPFFKNVKAPDECGELDYLERRQLGCARRASLAAPRIDRVVLSPTGSVAAFFSQSQGRIYAYANLAQSPVLVGTFEFGASTSATALAISDDGNTVLLGISGGDRSSVYLAKPQQAPRLVASLSRASAMQFLRNSGDAVIADDVENRIYALSNGQVYSIAAPEDGIASPTAIAISNDNRKVFVGNSASSSITTIGLDGTGITSTSCQCTLTALQSTGADSVYRLTDFSGGPVLLFDGKAATPRMLFVRAGAQF